MNGSLMVAQAGAQAVAFVATLNRVILFPTITLLTAVALIVFVWGCVEYVMGAASPEKRTQGIKHITYGIIGLVIMLSAYTILTIFVNTFSLQSGLNCATTGNCPTNSGSAGPGGLPNGTAGNGGLPNGTAGNGGLPNGTAGNGGLPNGTAGNGGLPNGTGGNGNSLPVSPPPSG